MITNVLELNAQRIGGVFCLQMFNKVTNVIRVEKPARLTVICTDTARWAKPIGRNQFKYMASLRTKFIDQGTQWVARLIENLEFYWAIAHHGIFDFNRASRTGIEAQYGAILVFTLGKDGWRLSGTSLEHPDERCAKFGDKSLITNKKRPLALPTVFLYPYQNTPYLGAT